MLALTKLISLKNTLKMTAMTLLLAASFSSNASLIINGSLNGTEGSSTVPAGWVINSITPDTLSATNQPFAPVVNPGDSPDGGTWVGLARNSSLFESFGQLVSGFEIGQTYVISWFNTNTGCCRGAFAAAAEILFDLDGTTLFTGSTITTDGNWYFESFSFVATSATHKIDFKLATGVDAYMGIDGISLVKRAQNVNEPSALAIILLGLIGVALRRKALSK